MPNVAPRGLYGRHSGTWKNPPAIYARVAGVWKPANFVYAMSNGVWQLIWGANPVVPISATAAWLAPHGVKITWVAPAVNTNTSWIVRRSDGSIAATVPVATLTVTDATPLLSTFTTGNKTLAAYTVEGTNGLTSSAKVSTGTVTWNLDPATQTTAVTYPSATTATVKVSWTPNVTYGEPDGWRVWRSDNVWMGNVLAGSTRSFDVTSQSRGVALNFRVVPFALDAAGAWVQAGNAANVAANSKATTPVSLVLTATTSPPSNLRLTWASGGGTVTAYEVQRSTNGTTWTTHTDVTSPSDWSTTVAGYMRVRATSPGGVSDWAQAGPKTPISDTTPPADAVINSLWPESSYGRMVIRFKTPTDADFAAYRIKWRITATGAVTTGSWVNANPNTAYAVVVGTFDAGDVVNAGVDVKDDAGNINTGGYAGYNMAASPMIIDPSGDKSGTHDGTAWRNDAVRSSTEIATGSSNVKHNLGAYFYGTTIFDQLNAAVGRTILSATMEYYRENEGGAMTAVQPRFNLHQLTARSGTPSAISNGASEAAMLGPGVVRSTPVDTATWTLPSQFIDALQAGTSKGICMYKGVAGAGDPDQFYMQCGIGAVAASGVVNGRLRFNHLG